MFKINKKKSRLRNWEREEKKKSQMLVMVLKSKINLSVKFKKKTLEWGEIPNI